MVDAGHGDFARQRLMREQQQREAVRPAGDRKAKRPRAFVFGPKQRQPVAQPRDQAGISVRDGSRRINRRPLLAFPWT